MRGRASKGRKAKGRKTKGRKTAGRVKTARVARSRTSKTRKTGRSAAKTRKTGRSAAQKKSTRKPAAPARKKIAAKTARKKSTRRATSRQVFGEGNYTGSREFLRDETEFVRRNRNKTPAMGQEAAAALDREEGGRLADPEQRAPAQSHSPGEEH